jgi:hypothetical protein
LAVFRREGACRRHTLDIGKQHAPGGQCYDRNRTVGMAGIGSPGGIRPVTVIL